jgi:uncharacterized protein (UPF0305 family)
MIGYEKRFNRVHVKKLLNKIRNLLRKYATYCGANTQLIAQICNLLRRKYATYCANTQLIVQIRNLLCKYATYCANTLGKVQTSRGTNFTERP